MYLGKNGLSETSQQRGPFLPSYIKSYISASRQISFVESVLSSVTDIAYLG